MSRIRANQITNQSADGAPTVQNGLIIAGVTTITTLDLNGDLDVDGHLNAENVSIAGVVTATTFSGSGASLTSLPAANLTGTAAAINGSNITNLNASNIASGTVPTARLGSGTASSSTFLRGDSTFAAVTSTNIVNNASGRLIVGSNTANTLDAKSEATYNGTKLFLSGGVGQDQHIPMLELKHLNTAYSSGNGDGPAILLNGYYASNEWALAKIAAVNAGGQYGSGYGGGLQFWVHPANGTQTASVIKGAEIIGDGTGANLTINNGNLVIGTSGHGIDFSATSDVAGKTSELFSDYEEGTFTPRIIRSGGGYNQNYNHQHGVYTRIGRLVHCYIDVDIHSFSGGSGHVGLADLPFTVNSHGLPGWPHSMHMARCYTDGDYAAGVDAKSIRFTGSNYGYLMNQDDDQWDYGNYGRVIFTGSFTYMV